MTDNIRERLQAGYQDAQQAVEGMFEQSEAYRLTLGEVMLHLYISDKGQPGLKMGLGCRKRPIFTTENEETDIALISGIETPEHQHIGTIPFSSLEAGVQNSVEYNGMAVEREGLADALCQLFSVIRGYEAQTINHPAGYIDTGVGRSAIVSVTGMDQLRNFGLPELNSIPDPYNTKYANPGIIRLPAESKVAFLPVRRR